MLRPPALVVKESVKIVHRFQSRGRRETARLSARPSSAHSELTVRGNESARF